MKFKTTIILIILVLAAGAYFWFIERDKPSTYELKLTEDRILKDFKPEQIVRIVIDSAERVNDTGTIVNTEHYDIQRDLTGWNLVEPANFPVDMAQMRQILDSIKKVEQSRLITGDEYKELDRVAAGLTEPDVVAAFYTPNTSVTLRIGNKTPIGWEAYLEVAGRPAAYYVPSQFKERLQLKTDNSEDDFRRRNVFDARKYEISSVFIESPATTIELQKGDDLSWRMVQPVTDMADKEKMEKLVEQIVDLDIRSFAEEPVNFDRPRFTLTVVQGIASQRLQVGDVISVTNEYMEVEKFCYARRSEYRQFITLKPSDLALFEEKPDDYRSKMLVVIGELEDPEHMTQEVNGERMEFTYEDKHWDIPEMTTTLEDEMLVEDYVFNWVELAVTGFVTAAEAQPHLANPWITLTFKFKGATEPRKVTIGRPVGKMVYAERSPGIFVTLDTAEVERLLVTNDIQFLNKLIVDLPHDRIEELNLQNESGTYDLMKSTNQWVSISGNTVRSLDADIDGILTDVLPVEITRYTAKITEKTMSQYGLASPRQSFRFKTRDKKVVTLSVGAEADGGGRYAMIIGQPYVFVLSEQVLGGLNRLFDAAVAYSQ
jgi:hypothetical protein